MGTDSLKNVIAKTMKASRELQAAEAAEHGMEPDEFTEDRRRLSLRKARAHAIVKSNILVGPGDVDAIADSAFKTTPAIEHVKAWAEDPNARPILFLCGGVGVGKTFACAVAIASAGHGTAAKSIELATKIQPYSADLARGVDPLNLRNPLLVLDDLGTESDPRERRWAEAFALLVEHRQMYPRTIVTTNLRRKQIRERYDTRIVDRLNACSTAVELAGKSRRATGGGL